MTYNMLYTYPQWHDGLSLALHYVQKDSQRIYFYFELENQTMTPFEFAVEAESSEGEVKQLEFQPMYSWQESHLSVERSPLSAPINCGLMTTVFCVSIPTEHSSGVITLIANLNSVLESDDSVFINFPSIDVSLNNELRTALAVSHEEYTESDVKLSISPHSSFPLYDQNGIFICAPSYDDAGETAHFLFAMSNSTQRSITLLWDLLSVDGESADLERIGTVFERDTKTYFSVEGIFCEPMATTEFFYTISIIDTQSKEIIAVLQVSTKVDLHRFSISTQLKKSFG